MKTIIFDNKTALNRTLINFSSPLINAEGAEDFLIKLTSALRQTAQVVFYNNESDWLFFFVPIERGWLLSPSDWSCQYGHCCEATPAKEP